MAYLKIFPIKVTDKKALDYITNPDKTDEKLLVSSFGCSPETADLEFSMTREMAKKNGLDKGDNLAFHLIQSFKPGEVDAENAHRLGQQFADEVLKGKYEYVISTHVDKNHIHNHIIFNAASFVDHHKYVSNKRSYHKLCRISNRICHENGLATSMPTGEKGKSYKENMEYHRGTSWKAKLRVAVNKAIWSSVNYNEFLQKMQLVGYEVRQGKHLSFRAPEQKNFTYMKLLGSCKKTVVDHVAGHIALTFELVYPISLQIANERGYLDKMMAFESDNEVTGKQFEEIRAKLNEYVASVKPL